MTVARLDEEMSNPELLEWMALDSLRNEEREKAQRLAKKGMRPR